MRFQAIRRFISSLVARKSLLLRVPIAGLTVACALLDQPITPRLACADEARFGDSTWVAPYPTASSDSEIVAEGPRVAEPDRTPIGETVLRFPFRVAFYPLRVLARGGEAAAGIIGSRYDPRRLYKALPIFSVSKTAGPAIGIRLKPPKVIREDWYGTFRATWSFNDHRRASIEQRFGEPTVFLGFGLDGSYSYRPNLRFYGIGNSSDRDRRAIFLEEEGRAGGFMRIGTEPLRQVRILAGYSKIGIGRGYNGSPVVEDEFSASDSIPFFRRGSSVVEYGVAGDLALLDDLHDPSVGLHGRGDLRRVHGVSTSELEYIRWHLEGRAYMPVFASRRVIALRGVYQGVDPRDNNEPIPYYRLPQSARETRFTAYKTGRFRDRQLLLAHAEYRWVVWESLWAVALAQWGAVAPNEDGFRLDDGHESYGLGLRYASKKGTYRLEVADGAEGIAAHFDFRGDF